MIYRARVPASAKTPFSMLISILSIVASSAFFHQSALALYLFDLTHCVATNLNNTNLLVSEPV
jgi:hypothetical protein